MLIQHGTIYDGVTPTPYAADIRLENGKIKEISPDLTPHPGEASRLLGRSVPQVQSGRIPAALELAGLTGGTALLKGAATVIARPDGRFAINPTGNPGMAKGGSGDVLSGIIGAFLSQGADPFQAARAAAYLHGLAGDRCLARLSARSMLPGAMQKAELFSVINSTQTLNITENC